MTDFYLKFTDEAEAKSVLYTVTPAVVDEEGEVITEEQVKPNYMNIDTLGILYAPPVEDQEPVPLVSWHVNVRVVDGEDGEPLKAYAVVPANPRRIWG